MGLLSRLLGVPTLRKSPDSVLRLAAIAGFATLLVYIVGSTISIILQLFELSSSEVSKFIKVIAALLNRPNLDLEFLPQEFEDLTPNEDGVYAYGPGNYNPLLFRRSSDEAERGAWQWSDDGLQWHATDSLRDSPSGVPEPPALVFILRLHIETLIRRRLANPAAAHRRLPPALDTADCPRSRLDAAPEPLCCPISHDLMTLPVVAPSGTTFEYDCIRRWAGRHNTDPVNGVPLAEADLYPNLALRSIIERWLQQQQQQQPEGRHLGQQHGGGEAGTREGKDGEGEGGEEVLDAEGKAAARGASAQPELEAEAEGAADSDSRRTSGGAPAGPQQQQQQLLPPHLLNLS